MAKKGTRKPKQNKPNDGRQLDRTDEPVPEIEANR